MFKIQVLGNPEISLPYVANALKEEPEDKGDYLEWYKEVAVLENTCDLEIDVMSNMFSADFEEIIPMVDGIIYFINPLNEDELEFFEIIYPIINSVKRDIPTIIVFYDPGGIIPASTLTLLKVVWYNFPEIEAFVNTPPQEFHEIIQCLNLALIMGDTPLNIENAWLRLPIFIEQANTYYKHQQFFYAAQAMRKVAVIADIYNMEEQYIYSEQTAYLFSRSNLYLEASKILKKVDKRKSKNYKRLYVEAMISEGNKLFNKKQFEQAAKQYEVAAQWTSIELKDKNIMLESFSLAINSWLSACKCSPAFSILDRLSHEEIEPILKNVSNKIIGAVDHLVSMGNLESARDQLYLSINTYQREGLFSEVDKFARKIEEILIGLMEKHLKYEDKYSAKNIYDEIENIWDAFKVPKTNLDSQLETLIKQFIEEANYGMASSLINKLNSLEIKTNLTEWSSEIEDKQKLSKKQEIEDRIKKGVEIILDFMEKEHQIVLELNADVIETANGFIKQEDHHKAAQIIQEHARYLKSLGKEEISGQILMKSLDFLAEGELMDKFFEVYNILDKDMAKSYIKNSFPVLLEKFEDISSNKWDFEKRRSTIERSNKMYRNHLLYEESRAISEVLVSTIKQEALNAVNENEDKKGIARASELIKQIDDISSMYLDDKRFNFDEIYKKIAEIYMSLDDLSSAHAYNDRIGNKGYKTIIHKTIAKIEATKSAAKSKQAEQTIKGELLKEKLSIIKKKSRDALNEKADEFRQRKAFKRAYYKSALDNLAENDIPEAIDAYKESAIRIARTRKYNLSAVSTAVACFLLISQDEPSKARNLLETVQEQLSSTGKFFSETFPIVLTEYILEIYKLNDDPKLKEAISYLENLPLFEEEIKPLYKYLGKELKKKETPEQVGISPAEVAKLRSEVNQIAKNIINEKQDIAKRKMMRRQYWDKALKALDNNQLLSAAMSYLDASSDLIKKSFLKHAAIGLTLGTLILSKEKDPHIATSTFEKHLKMAPELNDLPEIKVLKHLLDAISSNTESIRKLCIEHLQEKLYLFESEEQYLKSLMGLKAKKAQVPTGPSRKERADISKLAVDLDQTLGMLQQRMRDIRGDTEDTLVKRKAMKRRQYQEILDLLNSGSFDQAAQNYFKLAETIARRRDHKTTGLLLLLAGLCLLKQDEPFNTITSRLDEFLDGLGSNKNAVEETYHVQVLNLLIAVKEHDQGTLVPSVRGLLKILPLFGEEMKLIEI